MRGDRNARSCKEGGRATEHDLYYEGLAPLAIQHRILRRVPEKVWHLAGECVKRPIDAVIYPDPERVQEKTSPTPGVIACGRSGRHIGIDQRCGVHHTVNADRGGIAGISIGQSLLLTVYGTTHRTG